MRIWLRIRRAPFIPVCALTLMMFACVSAAVSQSSTGGAADEKKPATSPTTAPKHHTTTTKAPATSAGTTKPTSKTHTASTGKHSRKKSAHARGQQKIDSERAQAIQEALIREHYLSGEPTGTWNQASEEAMRRYQADHGWQSKTVPDSRALIKLGLGPSKDHLLNPESAMTTVPDPQRTQPSPTKLHSASPGADPLPATAPTPGTPTPDPSDSSRPQ